MSGGGNRGGALAGVQGAPARQLGPLSCRLAPAPRLCGPWRGSARATMLSIVHFLRSFFKVRGGVRGPAVGSRQRLAERGESRRVPLRPGPTAGHRVGGAPATPSFPTCRPGDRECGRPDLREGEVRRRRLPRASLCQGNRPAGAPPPWHLLALGTPGARQPRLLQDRQFWEGRLVPDPVGAQNVVDTTSAEGTQGSQGVEPKRLRHHFDESVSKQEEGNLRER